MNRLSIKSNFKLLVEFGKILTWTKSQRNAHYTVRLIFKFYAIFDVNTLKYLYIYVRWHKNKTKTCTPPPEVKIRTYLMLCIFPVCSSSMQPLFPAPPPATILLLSCHVYHFLAIKSFPIYVCVTKNSLFNFTYL